MLWDEDCQTHRLAFPVHGVRRGIVGAPTGAQTLLVAEFLGTLDIDDTRGETVVADVLVEKDVDVGIAVTGILRVAQRHIQR